MKQSTGFIVTLDVDETFLDGGIAFTCKHKLACKKLSTQCNFRCDLHSRM